MSERNRITVNVGDLIYDAELLESGLGVVTEVRPSLQVAEIREDTGGETGLNLGLPGTLNDPIEIVGSIPIETVAKSLVNSSDIIASLGYEFTLNTLHSAAARGPADFDKLM